MSVSILDIKLETVHRDVAIDVGTYWLQNDPDSPFHAVVDDQDMIEERCLLIWADIETPELRTKGRVGFCTVRICDEFVELYRIYVAPGFRRLGIARRALGLFSDYISKEGFYEFYIEVTQKEAAEFWGVASQDFSVAKAGHIQWKLSLRNKGAESEAV